MITTLIWATAFFLLGFATFIALPFGAASLPFAVRKRVSSFYFDLSMTTFERVLCFIRPNNECKLIRVNWNAEHDTEEVTVGETKRHYEDPANKESRLLNYPFSFVLSDLNKVITPVDALVGRELHEQRERDREWVTYKDTDGNTRKARSAHIELPAEPVAVNLQDARATFQESHESDDVSTTIENVKKSQQGFKTHSTLDILMIIGALAAGAGLAWLIWSNTGEGDSVTTLPLTLVGVVV